MKNLHQSLKAAAQTLIHLFLVACAPLTQAQVGMPISVKVYGQNFSDRVVYHYRVTNNSQSTVADIQVGSNDKNDIDRSNDVMELNEFPIGWSLESGIPSSSVDSPENWKAGIVLQEDSDIHALEWGVTGNDILTGVMSGQTLSGFSVAVAKADRKYVDGHALVRFFVTSERDLKRVTVSLESDDDSPPNMTVKVDPESLWPPLGIPMTVKAQVEVKDNLDPNPVVRLESITSSEALETGDISGAQIGADDRSFELRAKRAGQSKQGRVYTITYSATDATGNTSTASATVTVPHDQKKF